MTSGNPIRASGASEAHLGVSSLDCGAAVPRLAYGGAAFLEERTSKARKRFDRDTEIVRLCAKGIAQARVARKFGLSQASVSLIVRKDREPGLRLIEAREVRQDRLLELYEAGFSMNEIAAEVGVSAVRVFRVLREHPGYKPRCSHPRFGFNVDVPAWVPSQHEARFQRISASDGEEIAAGCIRKLKRLEARA